jgi:hypothetical protein
LSVLAAIQTLSDGIAAAKVLPLGWRAQSGVFKRQLFDLSALTCSTRAHASLSLLAAGSKHIRGRGRILNLATPIEMARRKPCGLTFINFPRCQFRWLALAAAMMMTSPPPSTQWQEGGRRKKMEVDEGIIASSSCDQKIK